MNWIGGDKMVAIQGWTDEEIVAQYWNREEAAIARTREKYNSLCASVCRGFLADDRDVEECLEDLYFAVWNSIPPNRPNSLKFYLCKIIRNIAINKAKYNSAEKRDASRTVSYQETVSEVNALFSDCHFLTEDMEITESVNRYLSRIPQKRRTVMVFRHWYAMPMAEIAERTGMNINTVKAIVARELRSMKAFFVKEGIYVE